MRGRSGIIVTVALAMLMLWLSPRTSRAQLFHRARGHHEPPPPTYTLGQVAAMVDELDHALFAAGMIDIKAPDVWGQNRMTRHRDEFERTMYRQLGNFQEILQAAQRRADVAAMSSATALSFSPAAPAAAGGSGLFSGMPRLVKSAGLPSTPVVLPPPVVNNNLSGLPAAVANGPGRLLDHAARLGRRGNRCGTAGVRRSFRPEQPARQHQQAARRDGVQHAQYAQGHQPARHQGGPAGRRPRADDPARPGGALHQPPPRAAPGQRGRRPDRHGRLWSLPAPPAGLAHARPGLAQGQGGGRHHGGPPRPDRRPPREHVPRRRHHRRDVRPLAGDQRQHPRDDLRSVPEESHARESERQAAGGRPTGARDLRRLRGRDDHDAFGSRTIVRTGSGDDRRPEDHPRSVRLARRTAEISVCGDEPVRQRAASSEGRAVPLP